MNTYNDLLKIINHTYQKLQKKEISNEDAHAILKSVKEEIEKIEIKESDDDFLFLKEMI